MRRREFITLVGSAGFCP